MNPQAKLKFRPPGQKDPPSQYVQQAEEFHHIEPIHRNPRYPHSTNFIRVSKPQKPIPAEGLSVDVCGVLLLQKRWDDQTIDLLLRVL